MTEFEEIKNENFFIVDSDNLNLVNSKLFGFIVTDDGNILQNDDIKAKKINSFGCGTYVWIKKSENQIEIEQDIDGSYGIYIFKRDSYFAISNSFLYLLDYIKEKYPLTFNRDYAVSFLSLPLNSMAFSQTLINEIEMIPRNIKININLKTKVIQFNTIDYKENSVDIDSEDGINLIDEWFIKWTSLLRNLKNKTDNIKFDLSGGYNSRVAFIIALGAGIDLNRININSNMDGLHTHCEDYEIAKSIADHFGFSLNNKLNIKDVSYQDINTIINISWYIKAGFHKQMYWKSFYSNEPVFAFGGSGGEIINGHGMLGITDGLTFLDKEIKQANSFSVSFGNSVKRVMLDLLKNVKNMYKVDDKCDYITLLLYKETVSRNHFGKSKVEALFSNTFSLQPLMDPILRRLKNSSKEISDTRLLMTVLLSRFIPDLLAFPFEGGRKLDQQTIGYAKNLNNKYPYVKKDQRIISKPLDIKRANSFCLLPHINMSGNKIKREDIENKIKGIYESAKFESLFSQYFPLQLYLKIKNNCRNQAFFPLQEVYASMISVKVAKDAEFSLRRNCNSCFEDMEIITATDNDSETSNICYSDLLKFVTSRIDIKNIGDKENNIELINCSDDCCDVASPSWFSNEDGKGIIVQSFAKKINLTVKCVSKYNSLFTLFLRTTDVKDSNKKRIPIYVKYLKLTINEEVVFDKERIISHDTPFKYEKKVTNNEIINIHLEWINV